MFQLAAFTDEISQDLERACAVCAEFGVKGAEIRRVWDTPVEALSKQQIQDIKRILDDHGMITASIGSPFGKCALSEPGEWAVHLEYLRRCGDMAHTLGCSLIRGFVFWDHVQEEQKPWDAIFHAYAPVPALLDELDVTLGIENEAACYVGTAAHTRKFLDGMACCRIKAIWDPANHVQDPQSISVPVFPEGYELIRKDVVHVHVKDAVIEPDGERPNVFLGMGLCCWPEQLRALRKDGFKGFLSLETHVNPDRFPTELEARFGHYLTGEGREPASKVCLAWLRDEIDAIV